MFFLHNLRSPRSFAGAARTALLCLAVLLTGALARNGQAAAATIDELIQQLSADEFVRREEAMLALIEAGPEVVDPLSQAMESGDKELVTRGAHVLLQLAMLENLDKSEPAYQSLRSMRESKSRTSAAIARLHINLVHEKRQKSALAELVAKGAELKEEFVFINAQGQAEAARTIEIGAEWRGDENDLRKLAWLYNIRYIAFRSDRIRGPWLKYAAQMESLESLSVRGGELDDAGIQGFVENKPKLRLLELKYVPVSNASLPKFRESLPNLISLKLYGTDVTLAAADELRTQMPRLDLDFRLGGFLGVGCQTHQLGCHVARVQADSAASRAGFNPGDVIISYAGEPVPDFDALTRLISSNRVKEKIRIELVRSVQTSTIMTNCRKSSLKVETKPHRLGVELVSIAKDSPLHQRSLVNRDPFTVRDIRKGDVIFRINGREVPKDKPLDEFYAAVYEEVRAIARVRAEGEVDNDADTPADDKERERIIERIVEQELLEERILIQFARGGEILTKDVVLGAWD